jgi:3-phenylpropionate/trans-cinnamate dioxygenase ferredoxin subunit
MTANEQQTTGSSSAERGGAEWQRVGQASALTEDRPLAVELHGTPVGVFLVNGEIRAVENVCPHAYALLSQGFVEGDTVECPLHGAIFQLSTGKCVSGPSDRDIAVFEAKVEGEDIFLRSRS